MSPYLHLIQFWAHSFQINALWKLFTTIPFISSTVLAIWSFSSFIRPKSPHSALSNTLLFYMTTLVYPLQRLKGNKQLETLRLEELCLESTI